MDTLYLGCMARRHAVWSKRFAKLEELEDEKHKKLAKLSENVGDRYFFNDREHAVVNARIEAIEGLHKHRVRDMRKLWEEEDKYIFDDLCPSSGPVTITEDTLYTINKR
jgi:hypothetical protein